MQEAGVSACAKHFPGQGQSPLDAHLGLPVLPTTWEEMKKIHLKPFLAAFQAGVHSVMSSHPVYPNLDPQNIPATFSRKIIHDYLRKELGYRGLILSDDLEMGALRQRGSVAEAAVQTAAAGHDVILICSSAKDQREAFHELKKAYEDGRLDSEELEKSAARIEALKKLRPERFLQGIPLPEKDGKTLAEKIAREGVAKGNPPSRSREENAREVTVIFPRLSEIGVKFALEPELENDAKCVAELLARHGIMPKTTVLLPLDPDEGQVRECLEKVSGGRVLFFCFDAHLFPGNRRLLESLQAKVRGLEVLFLRNPYDHEFLGSGILYAHAFGFRHAQIAAALDVLLGAGAAPHKARA
jgi:beta-N-acetylhexosaminidase